MYSGSYNFPNPQGSPPAFNGAPLPQNPHMHPGPSQSPQQQQQQPPQSQQQQMHHMQQQQMMYGQQFAMAGGQPNAYQGGHNPAMMAAAGAGMMQNTPMQHMGTNGQMAYQAPYTGSPYGAALASPAGSPPQMPPSYMMGNGMGQMNMAHMSPQQQQQHQQQQMMQRMHQAQQGQAGMGVSTPQRSSFNPAQGTPSPMPMNTQPGQFAPPQARATPTRGSQGPPPSNHQRVGSAAATPRTPTSAVSAAFLPNGHPPQVNGTSGGAMPPGPSVNSKELEGFSVLLDINSELLYEVLQLYHSQAEMWKAKASMEASGRRFALDCQKQQEVMSADYNQCYRRISTNLAYLAQLADRKPDVNIPNPGILMPPTLNLEIKLFSSLPYPEDPAANEASADRRQPATVEDPQAGRIKRQLVLKEQYKKLQTCFPDLDPTKDYTPAALRIEPPPFTTPLQPPAPDHGHSAPGFHMQKTQQMRAGFAPPMQG